MHHLYMSVGWHHVPALDFFSEAVRFMTIIKPFPPPIDHVSRILVPFLDFTLSETSQNQKEQDAIWVIFTKMRKWLHSPQTSLSYQTTNYSAYIERSSRLFFLFNIFCLEKKHIFIFIKIFFRAKDISCLAWQRSRVKSMHTTQDCFH